MKKIITILSLFTGIISNAQYIDHYNLDIEANVNYGFYSDWGNESAASDIASDLTGLQYEIGAYAKTQFDSTKSIGFVFSYLSSNSDYSDIFVVDGNRINADVKINYFSIGPSYKKSFKSFLGNSILSYIVTPGLGFYKRTYTKDNYSGDLSSTSYNFQISSNYAHRIIEPLEVFYTFSLSLIYFDKFKTTLPETVELSGDINKSVFTTGLKVGLGLRYKL